MFKCRIAGNGEAIEEVATVAETIVGAGVEIGGTIEGVAAEAAEAEDEVAEGADRQDDTTVDISCIMRESVLPFTSKRIRTRVNMGCCNETDEPEYRRVAARDTKAQE